MKGPQRIKRGRSFKKLASYLTDHDHGKQIFGHSTKELIATANQRRDIEKPVWHSSLSLQHGETLSDERWIAIAHDYMHELGFDDTFAYQIYLHDKENQQHIHLVASRVSIEKKVYLGQNENLKSTKIVEALEKRHGLVDTSNTKSQDSPTDKKLTRQEIEKSLRTGEAPARLIIAQEIENALKTTTTEKELFEKITAGGVVVTYSKNGAALFTYDSMTFSKTKLGYPHGFFGDNGNADKAQSDENRLDENRKTRASDPSTSPTCQNLGSRSRGFPYPRPSGWGDEMASAVDAVESGWTKKAGTDCRISVTSRPASPPSPRRLARDLRAWRSKKSGRVWFYTDAGLPTSIYLDKDKTAVCTKSEWLTREKAAEMLAIATNEFNPPLAIHGDKQFMKVMQETAKELGIEIETKREAEQERETETETETEAPRNRPRIRA